MSDLDLVDKINHLFELANTCFSKSHLEEILDGHLSEKTNRWNVALHDDVIMTRRNINNLKIFFFSLILIG